jgi:hypothetical protein
MLALPMERLSGDPAGIAALKEMASTHREFLKYLITEARTNSDHCATFQAENGTKWVLHLDMATGKLEVSAAE